MTKLGRGRATAIAMSAVISFASLLVLPPAVAAQTTSSLFHYPSDSPVRVRHPGRAHQARARWRWGRKGRIWS